MAAFREWLQEISFPSEDESILETFRTMVNKICLYDWDFSNREISDVAAEAIASALIDCSDLKRFSIHGCKFSTNALDCMLDALVQSKLKILDISHTELGNEGSLVVYRFLKKNEFVERLYLADSDFGTEGKATIKAIFDDTDRFLYIDFGSSSPSSNMSSSSGSRSSATSRNNSSSTNRSSETSSECRGSGDGSDGSCNRENSSFAQSPTTSGKSCGKPNLQIQHVGAHLLDREKSPQSPVPEIHVPPPSGIPVNHLTVASSGPGGRRRGYTFKMLEQPQYDPQAGTYCLPDTGRKHQTLGSVTYKNRNGEVLSDGRIRDGNGMYFPGPMQWVSDIDGVNVKVDHSMRSPK
eukprot:ANDGO_02314.mRNA.1 hypothetical protein